MGQIFHSCAYDIETKTCCVYDADKFHANCYAHSCSVFSVHYLLRQKPYNVMWGGGYVVLEENIKDFLRPQDLLGLSTYLDYKDFDMNDKKLASKSYYKDVKFIGENSKLWKRIDVSNKAEKYFNWKKNHSVEYSGYLLNHTKKLAIDLADYYEQSRTLNSNGEQITIDAVPALTETGGGLEMALFHGSSIESTDKLAGAWCGDLLQIVDELPKKYKIINCCFAEAPKRAFYCYCNFNVDKDNYILKNKVGERFQSVIYNVIGKRSPAIYTKVEVQGKKIRFIPKFANKQKRREQG